jgi:hypothetical protein
MTTPRRWAPIAAVIALVVPAVAWSWINITAYDAGLRNQHRISGLLDDYIAKRAVAQGRPAPTPPSDDIWSNALAVHWQVVGVGLFLLVGASVLAVLLRRSLRGHWWIGAAVAPAFAGNFGSLAQTALHGAAGWGVSTYTMEGPSYAAQGLHLPKLAGPGWLVWATAALGWSIVLLPAAVSRPAQSAHPLAARRLIAPAVVGALAALLLAGIQTMSTDGSGLHAPSVVGAALLTAAAGLLVREARWTSLPWLLAATWAVLVGTTSVSVEQLTIAAWQAGALVAAAALTLLPWGSLRARLNGGPRLRVENA